MLVGRRRPGYARIRRPVPSVRPITGRRPPRRPGPSRSRIGLSDRVGLTDHERLRSILTETAKTAAEPLWIVLIGHGTYDGREAKFNLRGPDVTDLELSEWLALSNGRS